MNKNNYEIFKKNFLDFFNELSNKKIEDFNSALMYLFDKLFLYFSFPSYKVVKLQGLEDKLNNKERKIINNIKSDIEKGNNFKKYMSTRIEDVIFLDILKNLHNIHHFHLGKDTGKKFVERSDKILFVYFSEKERKAYMICVKKHPKGKEWGSVKPLRILYKQYPSIFKDKILKYESIKFSDKDYKLLFKRKFNLFTEVKKGIYTSPLNYGINFSGGNIKTKDLIGEFYNKVVRYLENKDIYFKYEFEIKENKLLIIAYLKAPFKLEKELYLWDGNVLKNIT